MRKNVASQKVGAQLVSAADGSAFTGSVTVAVTVDAGTQATGSVGSGACTHEGNGYHSYAPAQAETNGNLIAFTFTGSGAIPVTVQVYTESLDPHDTVRMGLTALPNAAAEAAGGLYTRGTGAGQINQQANGHIDANLERWINVAPLALSSQRVQVLVGAVSAGVIAAASFAANALDAVWSTATRTLTGQSDSSGVTTLLSRLSAALASKLTNHSSGILDVVIGTGSTTTAVKFSTVNGSAPSATDDFYNGATLVYTSGALAGQRVSLNDYTGATTTATTSASTGSPANGVTAIIV